MKKKIILVSIAVTFLVTLCLLLLAKDGSIAQAQEKKFLADKHASKGLNCLSCHKENPPKEKVPTEVCLQCHGDYDKLAAKTAKVEPNPHKSHLGNIDCNLCHLAHKPPVNNCAQCHPTFNLKVK